MLDRFEACLKNSDARALGELLPQWTAVGTRATSAQLTRFDDLSSKMVRLLRDGLPLKDYLNLAREKLFDRGLVVRALNEISSHLTLDQIFQTINALGLPPSECREMRGMLLSGPGPAVTDFLRYWIEYRSPTLASEGESFSEHMKTMSMFKFIQWMPDDKGLSEAIQLLGEMEDPAAEALLLNYLHDPPWGHDRQATVTLLNVLSDKGIVGFSVLLKQVLDDHPRPGPFRSYLLWTLFEQEPMEGMKRLAGDLNGPLDDQMRFDYLDWIRAGLQQMADQPPADIHPDELDGLFSGIDTRGWSALARGQLTGLLKKYLPTADTSGLSSVGDRILSALVSGFMAWRLDHSGRVVPLAVLAVASAAYILLLNWLVAAPPTPLAYLDLIIPGLWLSVMGLTAATHYSGHETPAKRLLLALLFWTANIAAPLVLLGTRLYVRLAGGG